MARLCLSAERGDTRVAFMQGRAQERAATRWRHLAEERWLYPNGSELVFHNGLLIRVESKEKEEPTAP